MFEKERIVRVPAEAIISHFAGRFGVFPSGLKVSGKRIPYFALMTRLLLARNKALAEKVFKRKPTAFMRLPRIIRPVKPFKRRLPLMAGRLLRR